MKVCVSILAVLAGCNPPSGSTSSSESAAAATSASATPHRQSAGLSLTSLTSATEANSAAVASLDPAAEFASLKTFVDRARWLKQRDINTPFRLEDLAKSYSDNVVKADLERTGKPIVVVDSALRVSKTPSGKVFVVLGTKDAVAVALDPNVAPQTQLAAMKSPTMACEMRADDSISMGWVAKLVPSSSAVVFCEKMLGVRPAGDELALEELVKDNSIGTKLAGQRCSLLEDPTIKH